MYADFNVTKNGFFKAKLPSPLYAQMQFSKYEDKDLTYASAERETKYTKQVLQIIIQIVCEMGYNHVKELTIINKILMMIKQETYVDVNPKERTLFDAIVLIIRDTVRIKDGNFYRVPPSHHGTEPCNSLEPGEVIIKTINTAMIHMPIVYTEEILLIKKKLVEENVSLYNYENAISNYYSMNDFLVYKREIVNLALHNIDRMQLFNRPTSMPIELNGVARYLGPRDNLSLRLVSKSCYNNAICYNDVFKGKHVFDIFFLWYQERYYQMKTDMRSVLSKEQYKLWKKPEKESAKVLIVSRRYAIHEYVNSNVFHDNPCPLTCDLHSVVCCQLCLIGEDIAKYIDAFYGFVDFSPEVSCLLKMLISSGVLLLEEISKIVNDTIIVFREEHLLIYIYWYLRKNKRLMTKGCERVFARYRKRLIYWYLAYRSAFSMHKSGKPPSWSDMILRNSNVYRYPMGKYASNISVDFRQHDCMFRYDFVKKQYVRSTVSESFFQIPMLVSISAAADENDWEQININDGMLVELGMPLNDIRNLPAEVRRLGKRRSDLEEYVELDRQVHKRKKDDDDKG
jgi:hypothetical protein